MQHGPCRPGWGGRASALLKDILVRNSGLYCTFTFLGTHHRSSGPLYLTQEGISPEDGATGCFFCRGCDLKLRQFPAHQNLALDTGNCHYWWIYETCGIDKWWVRLTNRTRSLRSSDSTILGTGEDITICDLWYIQPDIGVSVAVRLFSREKIVNSDWLTVTESSNWSFCCWSSCFLYFLNSIRVWRLNNKKYSFTILTV